MIRMTKAGAPYLMAPRNDGAPVNKMANGPVKKK